MIDAILGFIYQAVNDLSPKQFAKFLDDISMMLADYEDGEEGER